MLWWLAFKSSCLSSRLYNLKWLSVNKSSSLSGTKMQGGTQKCCSAGAVPYIGPCFFFLLKQQRWQRCYHLFLDGGLVHHPHHPSMNTHAWGNCFACGHHWRHDDLHCSFCYCLSKREWECEWEGDLDKERLFFQDKVSMLKEEEWLLCMTLSCFLKLLHLQSSLFLWDFFLKSFSLQRGWSLHWSSQGNHCVGVHRGPALVALMKFAVLATMMPVVWATAASNRKMNRLLLLWLLLLLESRTPAALSAVWYCSKKAMSWSGSMGTILFVSAKLNWCAFGCTRKTCLLFS